MGRSPVDSVVVPEGSVDVPEVPGRVEFEPPDNVGKIDDFVVEVVKDRVVDLVVEVDDA